MCAMTSFLKELNPKQQEAASAVHGPVLVLAGAGSGKTRTLTYRIAHMIKSGIKDSEILAVTFTNKAAGEMRERTYKLAGQAPPRYNRGYLPAGPFIGTFHRFCLSILREDGGQVGLDRNFAILDADDQLSLMKRIMKGLDMSPDRIKPQAVMAKISNLKNELVVPEVFRHTASGYFEESAAVLYQRYQKELLKTNVVDFDDIIMYAVDIFTQQTDTLLKYQDRYPFVMVDEYQDTNLAQYKLINLLARRDRNLFVVGDDYQSIYGWRGANIGNILNFENDYPDAKIIFLEQNYRSTGNILKAASGVIEKNQRQKHKKLWTENENGPLILHFEAANEESEARYIADEIKMSSGGNYSHYAVLYRINAQSRMIEEQFLKYGIPYRIVGGIKFYERKEIKDMLAFLRLAQNQRDSVSFQRIINTPRRSIGRETIKKLLLISESKNVSVIEAIHEAAEQKMFPSTKAKTLSAFAQLIESINEKSRKMPLKELIAYVLEASGYKKYLLDGSEEGEVRHENVLELLSVADKYRDLEPQEALTAFLEEVTLATSEDNPAKNDNVVTLMTLHMAKGLEFDNVFIAGVEENILPHSRSAESPTELEEERRLCYVGITRAKKRLWLIHTRSRRLFGQTISAVPSRFLGDIPSDLIEKKVDSYAISEDCFLEDTDEPFDDGEEMYL